MFSAQTYIDRRNRLKKEIGHGLILLLGNEELGMNYKDNTYRFRQDSSFLYFFGINQPSLAAIIDADTGEEIIFGNDFSLDDIIWIGSQKSLSDHARSSGVYRTETPQNLEKRLGKAVLNNKKVHFLPPYRHDNMQKLTAWLCIPVKELANKASVSLCKAIIAQRSYKTAEEIVQLEEAVNISREMHLIAMQSTQAGKKEYEIMAQIQAKALEFGGQLAYPIIFSINGQTLHNHSYNNIMTSGKLALNDSGAENGMCYAGDITRTFSVDKKFTEQQKEIYNLVLKMQLTAIEALKPSVQYRDVHLLANKIMLEGLKQVGLVKGNIDDMLLQGVQGMFMPHGLGHAIGLDVHDMEDLGENLVGYENSAERSTQLGLKSLRFAKALETGFVLTVEPGIYFIPTLIEKWQAEGKFTEYINYKKLENYKNFGGIRIEDNCLITENGAKILGNPIPKTVEEIENLRAN